ncbi:PAS domain S-box protein [Desulforhopalus sp. 52FAK]
MGNELPQDQIHAIISEENIRLKRELKRLKASAVDESYPDPFHLSLIDEAMFPIVVVSVKSGNILYSNNYARNYFGVSETTVNESIAENFWENPDARSAFLKEVLEKGQVTEFKAVLRTGDNKRRHVLLSSRIIEYQSEQAIYSIFTDITDRIKAQEAYLQSEKNYRSMYSMVRLMADTLPDLIWAKDLDDKYLFANTAIREKLLKCRPGEVLKGKNDLFFATRERNNGEQHTFGEICINSDEIVKATGKKGRFLEDGLVRGKYLALDVHKAPMLDEHGKIIGTVGAGRDVTNDIKVRKALEESQKRFRLLANNIRDVLWIADVDLNPIYVTPSIEAFSGYTSAEFIRQPFITHMTPKYQRRFAGMFKRMIKTIKNNEELSSGFFEFECKRKNGSIVWVEIATSAMWDSSGRLAGFTGMIRDSTKRVQQQNQLKNDKRIAIAASQTKSEFLANMSHEIRTPMNGVLGLLQLLQETELSDLQGKYVSTALGAGKSLLKIISDILDFSKIEAGKVECSKGPVSLRPLVDTVLASFETMVVKDVVQISSRVDPLIPETIVACGSRLKQILFNLLGNAVKFTEKGTIALDVSMVERADRQHMLLQFTVEDTGIGMSGKMKDQLFQPFSQEDGSFRRKYGGTGLGLSIVKNLVEMMGGKIQVESTRGKGTRVSFTIVADRLNNDLMGASQVENDTPENEKHSVCPGKVLVVEDEQINAMVITAMLKSLGFEVVHAMDGMQAVSLLDTELFDCIFMDIQMPEMDGIETTREIRHSIKNNNVSIPIIALTAHAMKGDREQFMAAGMNDYLSKPVEVDRLKEVLKRTQLLSFKN